MPVARSKREGDKETRRQGDSQGRTLSYIEAVREATDQEMQQNPAVILFGLDVDDPKAIQGTTRGLVEKYGPQRVFGTPLSEDAMTGAAVGMALAGLRPIHVHTGRTSPSLTLNDVSTAAPTGRNRTADGSSGRASAPRWTASTG